MQNNQDIDETNSDCSEVYSRQIGNYILKETLGEGTYGKVKLATHNLTDENVAIKILNKHNINNESEIDFIKKEIDILKSLKHRNIIQIYEVIETEEYFYIVMELADSGDLFDLITENNKLEENVACFYFQQIISAVEYFHESNVVHRDLKPENILLDSKNTVKITDFGLSRFYNVDSLIKTPCGTPNYCAPEILKGEEYHGLFSDIWSIGVNLYCMLAGYMPFGESDENLLSQHIISGQINIPEDLSTDAKNLLMNMLQVDPMVRYDINQIKSHPWFNLVPRCVYIPGIKVSTFKIPVDENVLELITDEEEEKMKYRKAIQSNECNELTSTYYLMIKSFINQGGSSISDLRSKEYIEYMNDPENQIIELQIIGEESYDDDSAQSEDSYLQSIECRKRASAIKFDLNVQINQRNNQRSRTNAKHVVDHRKSLIKYKNRRLTNFKEMKQLEDVEIENIFSDSKFEKKFKRRDRKSRFFIGILEKRIIQENNDDNVVEIMEQFKESKRFISVTKDRFNSQISYKKEKLEMDDIKTTIETINEPLNQVQKNEALKRFKALIEENKNKETMNVTKKNLEIFETRNLVKFITHEINQKVSTPSNKPNQYAGNQNSSGNKSQNIQVREKINFGSSDSKKIEASNQENIRVKEFDLKKEFDENIHNQLVKNIEFTNSEIPRLLINNSEEKSKNFEESQFQKLFKKSFNIFERSELVDMSSLFSFDIKTGKKHLNNFSKNLFEILPNSNNNFKFQYKMMKFTIDLNLIQENKTQLIFRKIEGAYKDFYFAVNKLLIEFKKNHV